MVSVFLTQHCTLTARVCSDGVNSTMTCPNRLTQTLLLFVSGRPCPATDLTFGQSKALADTCYSTTHTRFFVSCLPRDIMPVLVAVLKSFKVKVKAASPDVGPVTDRERLRARLGGHDARRQLYKGWIEAEDVSHDGEASSYVLMRRDKVVALPVPVSSLTRVQGNPLSWRQLWKGVVTHTDVEPHVLRRQRRCGQNIAVKREATCAIPSCTVALPQNV